MSELNSGNGVKIISVESGSVAQQNGLRKDDVIVKVGRKAITSKDEYHSIIDAKEKGDVVMLKIERSGKQSIYAFTIR